MNAITLKNSFHNTSIKVKSNCETMQEAWFEIQAAVIGENNPTKSARAKLRKVEKALCGMDDCKCGTVRA